MKLKFILRIILYSLFPWLSLMIIIYATFEFCRHVEGSSEKFLRLKKGWVRKIATKSGFLTERSEIQWQFPHNKKNKPAAFTEKRIMPKNWMIFLQFLRNITLLRAAFGLFCAGLTPMAKKRSAKTNLAPVFC